MQEQRLKITLQLVKTMGEEGDSGDPDVTNPTRHRLKWSKESETHQMKQFNRQCLQIPQGVDQITFDLCTKLYLRSFSKARKN